MKFVWKNSSQILFQITFAGQICSLKSTPIFELFSKLLKICDFWAILKKIKNFWSYKIAFGFEGQCKADFCQL